MQRLQAAQAIRDHMQAAHRLWDAYREQGGDPADLLVQARLWRDEAGQLLGVVFEDDQVGQSFLQMTAKASRNDSPFDLFKTGLELMEALLRDLGVEEPAKPAAAPTATTAAPTALPAAPAVAEPRKPPRIEATIGIVPDAPAAGGAADARAARTAGAADEPPAHDFDLGKVINEVRVAIEMTPGARTAREDHLVQLAQLEKALGTGAGARDVALGRSCVRSLMFAADRVPNIASRLMTLLDALEA